jgi:hypothetical protein
MGWTDKGSEFESKQGQIFFSIRLPGQFWGSVSLKSNASAGSIPRVKQPGREADYILITNAELKNTWIYTSTSPYFMG